MTYEEIDPTIRNFLGFWQAFRMLGFSSDDIFYQIAPSVELGGHPAAYIVLMTQGKSFSIILGAVDSMKTTDTYEKLYAETTREANAGKISHETMDRVWQETLAFQDKAGFINAIHRKGIFFPIHKQGEGAQGGHL